MVLSSSSLYIRQNELRQSIHTRPVWVERRKKNLSNRTKKLITNGHLDDEMTAGQTLGPPEKN